MIVFEQIRIWNFISVGNSPVIIDYTKTKSTLVVAPNGSGKSAVLIDPLSFALYGCPYRSINKPQLVNSINGKKLRVEVDFKVNKTKYTVIRGMKPNVFEIYKNGTLLNQDAASRDYQKILETNILKMNYRTFTQIVIMGSGSYIPFMRLTPAQRREFIEDVLDIKVFSTMNVLLKQQMKDTDDEIASVQIEIKMLTEKIAMQQDFIKTLETEKNIRIKDLQAKVDHVAGENFIDQTEIDSLNVEIAKLQEQTKDADDILERSSELSEIRHRLVQKIIKGKGDRAVLHKMTECPTCLQSVNDGHRHKIVGATDKKLAEYEADLNVLTSRIAALKINIDNMNERQTEITTLQSNVADLQASINASVRIIQSYQKQITDLQTNTASTDGEKHKLKMMAKDILAHKKKKSSLKEERDYQDVEAVLLKDSGIKTKIIRQYIPVFNKLINSYLQKLDLFVSFNLDENFNETVKSRYRDSFTYESFSEGEKQRIDLALAFAFRTVARLKNAVNVNLLILDEVLDQSLDMSGIDLFFKLIDDLDKTNLFVISHRDGVEDKFSRNIKLQKKNNFTIIEG